MRGKNRSPLIIFTFLLIVVDNLVDFVAPSFAIKDAYEYVNAIEYLFRKKELLKKTKKQKWYLYIHTRKCKAWNIINHLIYIHTQFFIWNLFSKTGLLCHSIQFRLIKYRRFINVSHKTSLWVSCASFHVIF